jgi:hypothetical protein
VFVALSAIDLLAEADFRIQVSAAAITDTGFDVRFQSFRASRVWSASASFFAYDRRAASADPDADGRSARIESGTYAFARFLAGWELAAGGGERRYSVRIPFAKAFPGPTPPRVIACIAGLEASKEDDLRVRLSVDQVVAESAHCSVARDRGRARRVPVRVLTEARRRAVPQLGRPVPARQGRRRPRGDQARRLCAAAV